MPNLSATILSLSLTGSHLGRNQLMRILDVFRIWAAADLPITAWKTRPKRSADGSATWTQERNPEYVLYTCTLHFAFTLEILVSCCEQTPGILFDQGLSTVKRRKGTAFLQAW